MFQSTSEGLREEHLSGADRNGTKALSGLKGSKNKREKISLPSSSWDLPDTARDAAGTGKRFKDWSWQRVSSLFNCLSKHQLCLHAVKHERSLSVARMELLGSHSLNSSSANVPWCWGHRGKPTVPRGDRSWALLRAGDHNPLYSLWNNRNSSPHTEPDSKFTCRKLLH